MQKGLYEEEANHDLKAAIQAYQSVVAQHDEQRKPAATAVFRLGECYRKLGRTNDALAQYQRVLRDFTEQTVLVGFSREHTAVLSSKGAPALLSAAPATTFAPLGEEESEVRRIGELIRNSPDLVNAKRYDRDRTPLHIAASKGQLHVAEFLLANGADLATTDEGGDTALHIAAASGHKAMAELLLVRKGEPDARNKDGETPLMAAAKNGFKAIAELLLAQGAGISPKCASTASIPPRGKSAKSQSI